MSTSSNPVGVHELLLEVSVQASAQQVWRTLTAEIGSWWPRSFHMGGDSASIDLELRPGGRLYEDWGNDGGLLWGSVVSVQTDQKLQIVTDLFPEFGGPARGFLTWNLTAAGDQTQVRFTETLLGSTGPDQLESMHTGWRFLLNCLAAHVEGRPEPAWE